MQIVLIGGFEDTEKKNAIFSIGNELISRDRRVAIVSIEHEKSKDQEYIDPKSDIMIKEMQNIPCTFITDLMAELPEVNEVATYEYLLIEVPFSLSPVKVKEYLSDLALDDLSFAPIIYVFDVNNFKNDLKLIPKIVSKQILESDIIFTNADFTDQGKMEALDRTFKELNPDTSIFVYDYNSEEHRINNFVNMIIG